MSASARAFDRISPWIGVGAALAYFLNDRLELGAPRELIALSAALLVAGLLVRWHDASSASAGDASDATHRALRATALLFPASVAIAVIHARLTADGSIRSAIVAALVPVLLGWSVFLLLPVARRAGDGAQAPILTAPTPIVAALAAATIVIVAIGTRLTDHWTSADEVLYSMQARLFLQGDYRWHLEPAVQRFFTLPLMVPTSEGPYPQYPPGYPVFLSVFVALGAPWVSGAVLAAVAVASTYMLGRRTGSSFVGVVAAALLATHFLFLGFAARYLSHVAATTAITSAAWLLLTPPTASPKRRVVECVVAGFLIGIAVTIRPVTGVALAFSLWLWLSSRRGWRAMRDTTLLLGIGAAIPFAALLAYDAHTTGSPFRLGYAAAQGHLNDVGFGLRGLMLYDARGQRVVAPQPFGLVEALRFETGSVLWPLMRDLMPAFSALPLIATAYAYRLPVRLRVAAAFAVLPLVNFLYFENGERFYVELLPFAAVAVALVVARAWKLDAGAGRALTVFLLGASVASVATSAAADARQRMRHPSDGAVITRGLDSARRTSGRMLVFVRNPPLSEPLLVGLSPLNFPPFPGPIAVARDLGRENTSLICRMPDRTVVIAEAATGSHGARLLPTQPDSTPATACRTPALSPSTRSRE